MSELRTRLESLTSEQRLWLARRLWRARRPTVADKQDVSHERINTRPELVAWVQADCGISTAQDLQNRVKQNLPAHLTPNRIILVDEVPRNSSGKIDHRKLTEIARQQRSETFADHTRRSNVLRSDLDQNHLEHHSDHVLNDHSSQASSPPLTNRWSESECKLVKICEELLNQVGLTPESNFFDCGGDSLLSIQLIARARNVGVEIEPRDVLNCTSIAQLAFAAERRLNSTVETYPDQATLSVVSKIRSGEDGDHSDSILMVHEVGGQCNYAHYLASEIDRHHSVYATNQPPFGTSPTSIDGLAKLYADAFTELAPNGRVSVLAFCWGGPLAFAIAKEFHRRGRAVDRLLIVESGTEASFAHAPPMRRWIDKQRGNLVRIRNRAHSMGKKGAISDLFSTIARKIIRRNTVVLTADAGFRFDAREGEPEQLRANVQAFLDYRIEPGPFRIELFRVREPAGLVGIQYCDEALGWRYLVGSDLRIHRIPGTHNTCMQPPNVSELARQLNLALCRT